MNIAGIEMFEDEIVDIINQQEFVAIQMSGGIDSTTLCCIMLKYFPHVKVMPITFYNKQRLNTVQSMGKILHALNQMFPNNKLMPPEIGFFDSAGYISDPDNGPTSGIKNHPKDLFRKEFMTKLLDKYPGKLNFLMYGETLNPPVEIQELLMAGTENRFNKDRNFPIPKLKVYDYKKDGSKKYRYIPFRHSNKKQVAEVCKALGLMETVFPFTESCETEPYKYHYYGKTFQVEYEDVHNEPCQGCWPCREKYWAYGVFDFNTPLKSKRIWWKYPKDC
jgi:7-cyano-7-deazaguanine synthase in queuosine biosynthesis